MLISYKYPTPNSQALAPLQRSAGRPAPGARAALRRRRPGAARRRAARAGLRGVAPGRKRLGNAGGKTGQNSGKTMEKPRISLISDDFTKKKGWFR